MKKYQLAAKLMTVAGFLFLINCQNDTVPQSEADQNLIFGLLAGQSAGQSLEAGKDFALNGQWNSFTGSGTTNPGLVTISAKEGTGVWLTDAPDTGFGSSSICTIIHAFSNESGYVIMQNPPNNGACFSGDTNQGKYSKTVFFTATFNEKPVVWNCTVNATDFKDSVAEAIAVSDTTDRTNPSTTGCGGFSWSRLERK